VRLEPARQALTIDLRAQSAAAVPQSLPHP
jgi:hypothetical protein